MSMSKLNGKRAAQCSSSSSEGEGDGSQPQVKRRRQALVSYVLTAIKEDIKQEIRLIMADTFREWFDAFREVIKEELQHNNSQHAGLERTPSRSLENGDSRSLQLHFKTLLSSPLYTGKQIEGVNDASILIALIDANTGSVVESGPEASIKLDVVVLEGDFNKDNSHDWTREEFEHYQIREREGKAPLLVGNLQVTLKGGVGELGKLKFTDNSSWNKSKMYRIGLKVASGCCEGIRIREAITEALRVKDQRGESNKKHNPAKPDDPVWRLKGIAKGGPFHEKLRKKGIKAVEDLLREYRRDETSLRNVLGDGMTDTKWANLIDNAKSCVQGGKRYLYPYDEGTNHAVVFNVVGQVEGCTADKSFFPINSLPHERKEHLKEMVRKADGDWGRVKEFNSSIYSMENPLSGISSGGAIRGQRDYLDQSGCHWTSFDPPGPSELHPGSSRMVIEGYNETQVDESLRNIQNGNPSVAMQNPPTESINLPEVPLHQNSAPTEPYSTPPAFNGHSTSSLLLQEDQGWMDDLYSTSAQFDYGDEARMFDSDIDSWFMPPIEAPSPNLPRTCRSRTAVVSWLRIKAVFKWGFFVRRKVTSKVRPTIEQLN